MVEQFAHRFLVPSFYKVLAMLAAILMLALFSFGQSVLNWYEGKPEFWRLNGGSGVSGAILGGYHTNFQAVEIEGVDDNASGITYNADTGNFWIVINDPQQLIELDKDLNLLRLIQLENFLDTEAISYVGESSYVIADERDQTVVLAKIDEHTKSLNRNQLPHITLNRGGEGNKGFEGISVNPLSKQVYLASERDPMEIIAVSGLVSQQPGIEVAFPFAVEGAGFNISDLSGMYFDTQTEHLLMLSDESKRLVEVDLEGREISQMSLKGGFNGLVRTVPQPEGVTLDGDGNLYVVSEPNLIYRFSKVK